MATTLSYIQSCLSDSTLVARKIDELGFGLYASPVYLALHSAPQHPDELEHHAADRLLSARGDAAPWKLIGGKAFWEVVPPGHLTLHSPDMPAAFAGRCWHRCVTESFCGRRASPTFGADITELVYYRLGRLGSNAHAQLSVRQDARLLAHREQIMERG